MMFNFHESLKILSDYEVEFVVKNSRNLRADSMIGEFKMTLGRVYSQPGELSDVPFKNPKHIFDKISGL